eukprot:1976959-Rhodomonas_salina.1
MSLGSAHQHFAALERHHVGSPHTPAARNKQKRRSTTRSLWAVRRCGVEDGDEPVMRHVCV